MLPHLLRETPATGSLYSGKSPEVSFLLALASGGTRPGWKSEETCSWGLRSSVFMSSRSWASPEQCCLFHSDLVVIFPARFLPWVETKSRGCYLKSRVIKLCLRKEKYNWFPRDGLSSLTLLLLPGNKLCIRSSGPDVSKRPSWHDTGKPDCPSSPP